MKLENYIARLLNDHNCVIVPQFGGFVANYRSAVIDDFSKKIHPPSKSVLFNPHLVNNDGLLGNYVSRMRDIAYPQALEFIAQSVTEWSKGFETGGRIEIGEIGFLYKENGTVHFEQSREINLLLQSFGLRSISFVRFDSINQQPIKLSSEVIAKPQTDLIEKATDQQPVLTTDELKQVEEKQVKVIEVVDETLATVSAGKGKKVDATTKSDSEGLVIALDQEEEIRMISEDNEKDGDVIPIRRNVTKTVLRYAAAAAFVPLLFYSYWIPMETDALETSSIQLTDFNPIHDQPKKNYLQRTEAPAFENIEQPATWDELTENIDGHLYNLELSEDFFVTVSLRSENNGSAIETLNTSNGNKVTDQTKLANVSGQYHVIAGCFSVAENAENLVKDLKASGFSASILDQSGGLTRVSAGAYATRDDADSSLDKLKNTGQSGWILKK